MLRAGHGRRTPAEGTDRRGKSGPPPPAGDILSMHRSGSRLARSHGFDAGGRNPAERAGRYCFPEAAPGFPDLHLRAGYSQGNQGENHFRRRAVPVRTA